LPSTCAREKCTFRRPTRAKKALFGEGQHVAEKLMEEERGVVGGGRGDGREDGTDCVCVRAACARARVRLCACVSARACMRWPPLAPSSARAPRRRRRRRTGWLGGKAAARNTRCRNHLLQSLIAITYCAIPYCNHLLRNPLLQSLIAQSLIAVTYCAIPYCSHLLRNPLFAITYCATYCNHSLRNHSSQPLIAITYCATTYFK
jgi:hypothetical protein